MLGDLDLFALYRWLLAIVCTVYAAVRLWQTIYGWWVYLWSPQPGFGTLRRYLFVQALRVRARRFAGPLLEIVVLSAVLIGLLWLHRHLGYVG